VANKGGSREIQRALIPTPLLNADYYTMSVSLQPAIIKFALDEYVPAFAQKVRKGPHYYPADIYKRLGI
ncbi:molecular chaperone Tir, partial [Pseudomonas sp. DCB_CB]|nr:molecular chaperone Tir [Pseudomonas sp. DCB_BZ]MCX2860162.1 molecular chaperone Tir [Pseudomonas sp. DCB_CB]